jgi:D-glycero-D-manno-heptose 1,7-bisphosphate phosphatase
VDDANVMSGQARKALFLDRDGVVNVDRGYVHRIDQIEFCPGIFDLVHHARRKGYAVVIVTNQAGIGRGLYTEGDFARLSAWMLGEFARCDAVVDRIYHCPDHPQHGIGAYRRDSPMRKPQPGMLLQAAADLGLDLKSSIMVGDKESDIAAGIAAGVALTVLLAPELAEPGAAPATRAGLVVQSLRAIVDHLH